MTPPDSLLSVFTNPAVRSVAAGASALGLVAGAVGSFAVLRRQSLQGDVVSHAALPGVAVAFILGARSPALLVVGAAVAGWVAMAVVGGVTRRSRVPADAALGGVLAVFFGLGVAMLAYVQRHVPGASQNRPEQYLFGGQAALMGADDLVPVAAIGVVSLAVMVLFWKEFKLLSFDPDYAASLGLRVRLLDLLLTTLVVVAVVIGLQAVGVVLMTALLVAPAAAARQWTNRLGPLVVLAGVFGAAAGFAGVAVSHALGEGGWRVPTGPTVVLSATAIVIASLLFGAARGVVWRGRRSRRLEAPPFPDAGA